MGRYSAREWVSSIEYNCPEGNLSMKREGIYVEDLGLPALISSTLAFIYLDSFPELPSAFLFGLFLLTG